LSSSPNLSVAIATVLLFVGGVVGAGVGATSLSAQERHLGSLVFENSGAPTAQGPFITGVLLLHSFQFEDAATEFQRAQEIDPEFALAYWGEAMTYNHPLWRQQDMPAALGALSRYAETAQARQEKAPTPREAAYLAALDILYGEGTKTQRDLAYMNAMRRLSDAYPNDLEARAFYSLAILGSTDGERDFATYMKAAAVAQEVSAKNPDHPGGAHYTIHSFDDPVHAPLGLNAARAYSQIAPDAGHAQHMTSHIFVALGMWDELEAANIRARDLQNGRRAELGRTPNPCGHYTSWLHYGWLQQGKLADAERGMAECHERVLSGATPSEVGYFVSMRARHVLDLADPDAAERLSADVDRPGYDFVTALTAARSDDLTEAQSILAKLNAAKDSESPRQHIARMELAAVLDFQAGDPDKAIAQLVEAATLEESLPFEFGPPASLQPPHELLGMAYMMSDRPEEAAQAFRRQLAFTPLRTRSLVGLATAALAAGDSVAATDARSLLDKVWKNADAGFAEEHGPHRH
jgi:tetratricopeptide (TPR) repeat protein